MAPYTKTIIRAITCHTVKYTQSDTAAHAPTINAKVLGKDCPQ